MDNLIENVENYLRFENAEGWIKIMGQDYMTPEMVADPRKAWGGNINTYTETERGTRIYGSDEYLPESYIHDCAQACKNTGHILDIPNGPSIRYVEGNPTFAFGRDVSVPVSAIPAIIRFLASLPISVTPAPLNSVENMPALAQRPNASQELKELEQRDREQAMQQFVKASSRMFPTKDRW